jgi:hypothetical protein
MRVVATLTTMPHRYSKLLQTLKYLHQQTHKLDEIYLGIPKISKRLNIEYPPVPQNISDLCTVVELPKDYGPISKLMGALISERDPNTLIFSFDDDVHYPPNLVESFLLTASAVSKTGETGRASTVNGGDVVGETGHTIKSVVCGSAFILGSGFPFYSSIVNVQSSDLIDINRIINAPLNKNGREVDIVCGFAGVLYRRNFFDDDFIDIIENYFMTDENLFLNDDVAISAYLSFKGIKKMIYPLPGPIPPNTHERESNKADISYDKIKFLKRFNKAIEKSREIFSIGDSNPSGPFGSAGVYKAREKKNLYEAQYSNFESAIIAIIILILLFIIFIFLCVMFYKNIPI